MSVFAGPNIASNSDLVFAYDISNTQKSWIGAPTTNLISDPYALSGNPSPLVLSGYETTNTRTTTLPNTDMITISNTWFVATKTTSTNGRVFFLGISPGSLSTMTDYCFSMYAYTQDTNISSISCITDNGAVTPVKSSTSYNVSNRGTIQRINCVFTSTTGGQVIGVRVGSTNPVGSTFYFTGIQVEAQSFPTPVVNGTRSNAQSLIDLTRNNTITATSLTYSSTGTFSFNGSNRVNLTMTGSSSLSQYTRIVWINPTVITGDMKSAMLNQIGNNSDMAVGIEAGYPAFHQYTNTLSSGTAQGDWTLRGATLTSINNTYMIAATVDRSTSTNNVKIYLNGVLDGTASITLGVAASDNVIFGGPFVDDYSGSRMFYGDIYAAYQYNRVLTAAEIAQNFNATRSRFGL